MTKYISELHRRYSLIDIASQRNISRFVYCKGIVLTVVSMKEDIVNKLFLHLR